MGQEDYKKLKGGGIFLFHVNDKGEKGAPG